jgi:hypothetical protein
LDGGEGDKNPVIAPQMPTGDLIGQAVFDHQPDCQGNDAMGVVGFGQSIVGHVRVKELAALGATVPRVNELDVARPGGNQVADVMQDAGSHTVSKASFPTERTRAMFEVAAAANDPSFG